MHNTQSIVVIKDTKSPWYGYKAMVDSMNTDNTYNVTILEPVTAPQGLGFQLGESIVVQASDVVSEYMVKV